MNFAFPFHELLLLSAVALVSSFYNKSWRIGCTYKTSSLYPISRPRRRVHRVHFPNSVADGFVVSPFLPVSRHDRVRKQSIARPAVFAQTLVLHHTCYDLLPQSYHACTIPTLHPVGTGLAVPCASTRHPATASNAVATNQAGPKCIDDRRLGSKRGERFEDDRIQPSRQLVCCIW